MASAASNRAPPVPLNPVRESQSGSSRASVTDPLERSRSRRRHFSFKL
jgi:hypothetical protein